MLAKLLLLFSTLSSMGCSVLFNESNESADEGDVSMAVDAMLVDAMPPIDCGPLSRFKGGLEWVLQSPGSLIGAEGGFDLVAPAATEFGSANTASFQEDSGALDLRVEPLPPLQGAKLSFKLLGVNSGQFYEVEVQADGIRAGSPSWPHPSYSPPLERQDPSKGVQVLIRLEDELVQLSYRVEGEEGFRLLKSGTRIVEESEVQVVVSHADAESDQGTFGVREIGANCN